MANNPKPPVARVEVRDVKSSNWALVASLDVGGEGTRLWPDATYVLQPFATVCSRVQTLPFLHGWHYREVVWRVRGYTRNYPRDVTARIAEVIDGPWARFADYLCCGSARTSPPKVCTTCIAAHHGDLRIIDL